MLPSVLVTVYTEGIKVISEIFVKPFLKNLNITHLQTNGQSEESLLTSLDKYLTRLYKNVSVVNIIDGKRREVILDDIYIPLTLKNINKTDKYIVDGYCPSLFKSNSNVLINATAGMGKSTIIKKLILSIISNSSGIPILIELRRLSKNTIIELVLEQLNQLTRAFDEELLLQMIDYGNFFFFFDGYDEVALDDKIQVTNQLNDFISKASNNYFIITSRPDSSLQSFGSFSEYGIQKLNKEQAHNLIRKYGCNGLVSNNLIKKIMEPRIKKYIREYLETPLLVSLLYHSFEYNNNIPDKKHLFYRQVYDSLYESHDYSKGQPFIREKKSRLLTDDFHRLLRCFGFVCLTSDNKIEFTKDGLVKALTNSLRLAKNLILNVSDFIDDITVAVPVMIFDGLYYQWSHKSLQEYFAAQYIYQDAEEKDRILLQFAFHENNSQFINTLDLYKSIDENSFKQTVLLKYLEDLNKANDKINAIFPNENTARRIYHYFTKTVIAFRSKYFCAKNANKKLESNILHNDIKDNINHISFFINYPEEAHLEQIDYINFPKLTNKYHALQPLIDSYNLFKEEFSSNSKFSKVKIKFNIPFDEVVWFTEDITSELNNAANFDAVSTIMNYYLDGTKSRMLNEKRINDLLKEIRNSKSDNLSWVFQNSN